AATRNRSWSSEGVGKAVSLRWSGCSLAGAGLLRSQAFILIRDLEASPTIRACSSVQQGRMLELLRACQRWHGGQSSFRRVCERKLASKNAVARGAPAKCRRAPTTLPALEDMRAPECVPSHTRACPVVPHSDRIQQYSSTHCDLLL